MNAEATDPKESFEDALRQLERIVTALDRDELELDQALGLFSEGVNHLKRASQLLDAARGRVDQLIESASGELSTIGLDSGLLQEAGDER